MTEFFPIDAVVVLTDSNRTGDHTFKLPSDLFGNGEFITEDRDLPDGSTVAALTRAGDDTTAVLFRVEPGGINKLDNQPSRGDLVYVANPMNMLQIGLTNIATDSDGHVVTVGLGVLLAMFRLLSDEWVGRVTDNLAALVPDAVNAYLAASLTPEPEPEPDADPEPTDPEPEPEPTEPDAEPETEC